MGLAVLTIVVSVLLGTLLAFVPRQKANWMGPLRTFGLAAAISVVVFHMVPESIESIGAWAVPGLLLGLVPPAVLGRVGSVLWRAGHRTADPRHVALEAGYAGLLVHKVGDGVALGVYAGELHPGVGGQSFAAALAAHIVPVVAIVVLTFDSVRGRGSALWRAFGLLLAGLLGVSLAHSVVLGPLSLAHGWLSAIAAGMLLHVLTHDLGLDLPQTHPARFLDLGLAGLGLSASLFGEIVHEHHGSVDVSDRLLEAVVRLATLTAPVLVAALLTSAWLTTILPAFGASRPAWIVSRAFSRSLLGLETMALTLVLLGWQVASLWLCGALALITVTAVVTAAVVRAGDSPAGAEPASETPGRLSLIRAFDARFSEVGGWVLLGLLLAAVVDVSLPVDVARPLGLSYLALLFLLAAPGYLCSASAIPLAAVLLDHGIDAGSVIVGLLLGPSVRALAELSSMRRFESKALAFGLLVAMLLALAFGLLIPGAFAWGGPWGGPSSRVPGIAWSWALGLSGLAWLRAMYKTGFRGFLESIGNGQRPAGHHGHAHGVGESHLAEAHLAEAHLADEHLADEHGEKDSARNAYKV
jgi:uncharacterized protein